MRIRPRLVLAAISLVVACRDSTAPHLPDGQFRVEVRGAIEASFGGPARAATTSVSSPLDSLLGRGGGTLASLGLLSPDGAHSVTIGQVGTGFVVGEHRMDWRSSGETIELSTFTATYMRQQGARVQLFLPDSGTIVFTETTPRVRGHLVLYASEWAAYARSPVVLDPFGVLTPEAEGTAPITIRGEFDAVAVRR
jgi:hypothetical protein